MSPEGQAPTSPGHRGLPSHHRCRRGDRALSLRHWQTSRRPSSPGPQVHPQETSPGCGRPRSPFPATGVRPQPTGAQNAVRPPRTAPRRAEATGRPTPPKHAAERPQRLRAHGSVHGRGPEQARPGDGTEQRCPGREGGRGDCGGDGVPFGARDKALDPDGGTSAQLRECYMPPKGTLFSG